MWDGKNGFSIWISDVEASINGEILSVKNPKSGSITADKINELIYTADSKFTSKCKIYQKVKH